MQTMISKGSYFLLGLGIGSTIGILFAPKSGEETREYLAQKTRKGTEYAREKAQELKNGAEDVIQRGKNAFTKKQEEIATAIDGETYQRGKSNAQGA